ncbi:MAG: hypothetical protein ABFD98_06195 [Syntrophobacteraceae bacterium]
MENTAPELTERNEDDRLFEELDEEELSYLLAGSDCCEEFYH